MLNLALLPDDVIEDLRENHSDEQIQQMSVNEAFDRFLDWNGIIGYGTMIRQALDGIRLASVQQPKPDEPICTGLKATFRDLQTQLNRMTDEQLDSNLAVELQLSEEIFSSVTENDGTVDVRLDIADENHDLDENHPVIVVQF